jgi:deoxyribodipyrimidine photo-lyase
MQLIWFRQDLRIEDNTALLAATDNGLAIGLYIFTPEQWRNHDDADIKVEFIRRHVTELSQRLSALNIPLIIRTVGLWEDVPQLLKDICVQYQIDDVYVNDEYGVNERQRDQAVKAYLAQENIGFHCYQDRLLFAPGDITNQSGQFFKVFTPFKKHCLSRLHAQYPMPDAAPMAQQKIAIVTDPIPAPLHANNSDIGDIDAWGIGEEHAQTVLADFIEADIQHYHIQRDFPAKDATSHLAAYLNIGVLSIRQCLHAAIRANNGKLAEGESGVAVWISELLWREFYHHILVGYPRVSRHQPFKLQTNQIAWRNAPDELHAWQTGQTGFPIIDAAMRQLKQTGWMHNRLRMIVAMFLTKNLLIDWREGERWFMQHLIDGDLAANNGGWQWSASTGTDSVPYFRIFNPISQSKKFDPHGAFIRRWLPELKMVDDQHIHAPFSAKDQRYAACKYPQPMVDLSDTRKRALAAFSQLSADTDAFPD